MGFLGATFLKRALAFAAFLAWGVVVTVISSTLLGSHLLTLPVPEASDPTLVQGVASLQLHDGAWSMVHALSSECRCSQAVLAHLLATERPVGVDETVLLVGPVGDLERDLRAHGFAFASVTAAELQDRFGVPAVPVLVVSDSDGAVVYSGGYTARKQGPEIDDLAILGRLQGGAEVAPMPLFGCAVNTELRESLDPLGVR